MEKKPNAPTADQPRVPLNRRAFLSAGVSSAAVPLFARGVHAETVELVRPAVDPRDPANVTLEVNGRMYRAALDVRTSLLDALREHLGLTGAKKAATTDNAAPARCSSKAGGCSRA